MAKKKITYEEALSQIETILSKIRQGEIAVDELSKEVSRATELIKYCRERLHKAEEDVREIIEK